MRRKLLLADDSITVQRVIELTFSDEGLEIATVGDGTQAIERLQRDRPEIVLADLNMPGADGYEVAEFVKRGSDLVEQTRVVLLTGAFEPVDQERARLLGVDGVLAKPFEPQVAIALVRELLEQAPLHPPRIERPATAVVSDWTADVLTGKKKAPELEAPAAEAPAAEASAVETPVTDAPVTEASATEAPPTEAPTDAPVAAGYPFEPGMTGTRSSPAELDDYFKRLDEALTNAGLMASPAVQHMLADAGKAGTGTATAGTTGTAGEERQMSGMPSQGPVNVTLVDAFSALLAAEQGEGTAAATFPFWGTPSQPASTEPANGADTATPEHGAATLDVHAFSDTNDAAYAPPTVETAAAPESAAPVASAPAITEAQIEAIVRRVVGEVVGEMADRIVREIAGARVLDVAERLVREEIDRLKADAEAGDKPETPAVVESSSYGGDQTEILHAVERA